MVPAYLLSLLKQELQIGREKFGERYPYHWLVWEPGTWTAPATGDTVQIGSRNLVAMGGADALSFALKPNQGRPDTLTLGRGQGNDIVINDATVSRQHARLKAQPSGSWAIEIVAGVKALSRLGEQDLPADLPTTLLRGSQLRLGDARLTYYDLAGLIQRLTR